MPEKDLLLSLPCRQSAQRLIESLESLEYIGPMEMFTKLSKVGEQNSHVNSCIVILLRILLIVVSGGCVRLGDMGQGKQLGHCDRIQVQRPGLSSKKPSCKKGKNP